MRNYCLLVALVAGLCSFAVSQTNPSDPSPVPSPAASPAAADSAQPQKQMPPDEKAPAPIAGASAGSETPVASGAPQAAAPVSTGPKYLNAGTDIRASLDTPLSTKTSKVGDRFTATVAFPVKDSSGNIVVPVGSKLNGQISEPGDARVEGAIKEMAHLDLRFTDIQLPTGADVPLSAVLISVHNSRPANAQVAQTPRLTGSSAIAANGGFTGGLGRPIKGLAVGNLAGGGYVLSPSGRQVDLPAECVLRLRVDKNTTLP